MQVPPQQDPPDEPDAPDRLDLELRYAWDWFEYHARQRLMAFNFFLLLTSAVIVGYSSAATRDAPVLGASIALLGATVAAGFIAMDIRNTELVNYGVRALNAVETKLPGLGIRTGNEAREALEEAYVRGRLSRRLSAWTLRNGDRRQHFESVVTHRFWLRLIESAVGCASIAAAVWAILGFPGQPSS